jgi:hypothetical protein
VRLDLSVISSTAGLSFTGSGGPLTDFVPLRDNQAIGALQQQWNPACERHPACEEVMGTWIGNDPAVRDTTISCIPAYPSPGPCGQPADGQAGSASPAYARRHGCAASAASSRHSGRRDRRRVIGLELASSSPPCSPTPAVPVKSLKNALAAAPGAIGAIQN